MGMHLMGAYFMGVYLMGVYFMGVHLMGVYYRMQPFYLSRTYVIAAFGGRWPDVAFLFLAPSGNFSAGWRIAKQLSFQ
jgi:hypothetical protein